MRIIYNIDEINTFYIILFLLIIEIENMTCH